MKSLSVKTWSPGGGEVDGAGGGGMTATASEKDKPWSVEVETKGIDAGSPELQQQELPPEAAS